MYKKTIVYILIILLFSCREKEPEKPLTEDQIRHLEMANKAIKESITNYWKGKHKRNMPVANEINNKSPYRYNIPGAPKCDKYELVNKKWYKVLNQKTTFNRLLIQFYVECPGIPESGVTIYIIKNADGEFVDVVKFEDVSYRKRDGSLCKPVHECAWQDMQKFWKEEEEQRLKKIEQDKN